MADQLEQPGHNQPPARQEQPPAEQGGMSTLMQSAEVREAVAKALTKIPELIDAHIKGRQVTTRNTIRWLLVWILLLASIVVGAVTFLTFKGKLSSDALAFLLGTIVGAAFTFMRDFFPSAKH